MISSRFISLLELRCESLTCVAFDLPDYCLGELIVRRWRSSSGGSSGNGSSAGYPKPWGAEGPGGEQMSAEDDWFLVVQGAFAPATSICISFLLMNHGVHGALYRATTGAPMALTSCFLSHSCSFPVCS